MVKRSFMYFIRKYKTIQLTFFKLHGWANSVNTSLRVVTYDSNKKFENFPLFIRMSLEELPVEILLKICESLNFEDLVLGLRPLSKQLASEIDNLILPELSKDQHIIDGRGIFEKAALKETLKFIREMKRAELAKKVFLQNLNLRPMQIPFSPTLVALNVKDCCKFRISDFESIINKCHSLEEFSFDLGCHLGGKF